MKKLYLFFMFIVFALIFVGCEFSEESKLALQKSTAEIAITLNLPPSDRNSNLVYDWDSLNQIVEDAKALLEDALTKEEIDNIVEEAKTAIEGYLLSDETKDLIKEKFLEEYEYELDARYYGRYKNAYVFFINKYTEEGPNEPKNATIQTYTFQHNADWLMIAWETDTFYNLEEAAVFEEGILTKDDVYRMYSIHHNWRD
ncbi:MAG: hypothetical protein ACOX4W_02495 [Bacilli bacterium]